MWKGSYMIDQNWWVQINGNDLFQGDYLHDCPVPVIPSSFNPSPGTGAEITIEERNLIILTQSCDLAQNKASFVALCSVYRLEDMEKEMPKYAVKGAWESVRQGRVEGFHMLAGLNGLDDNRDSLIVDFRQIYSLPIDFLKR